jgi:hypothetical protein
MSSAVDGPDPESLNTTIDENNKLFLQTILEPTIVKSSNHKRNILLNDSTNTGIESLNNITSSPYGMKNNPFAVSPTQKSSSKKAGTMSRLAGAKTSADNSSSII